MKKAEFYVRTKPSGLGMGNCKKTKVKGYCTDLSCGGLQFMLFNVNNQSTPKEKLRNMEHANTGALWIVVERNSGLDIDFGYTQKEAIENAASTLAEWIDLYGVEHVVRQSEMYGSVENLPEYKENEEC